jgi:fatty-acyl-CoA synthase
MACAAVGEPDAYAGELPVVFVSLKPGQTVSPEALLREVARTIPEPPAVPKRVVVMGELPMTPIGKIFKPALRAVAAELKVRALLTDAAPDVDCKVSALDQGGLSVIHVALPSGLADGMEARLRGALAELPISIKLS